MKPAFLAACCALTLSTLSSAPPASAATPNEKKIIYYGWNTRDSLYVSQRWAQMEQMPFDGVAISIALNRSRPTTGNGSTGNLLGWQVFGATAFNLGSFSAAITDLRKPAWSRFTDNFLPLAIATRDQDQGLSWFDDARWSIIENNWRLLVTLAREGRCRGVLLDPEHYDYECELFSYADHRAQRANRLFAEYTAAAHERGRRLGEAIRELFPDINVGFLYGYTLANAETAAGVAPEQARYALLAPFLDGLLEGAGPDARFFDLYESGHGYKRRDEFLRARDEILSAGKNGVLKPGMSLRIDYPKGNARWQPNYPDKNHFSPKAFEMALRAALEASDRYVWIYSEDKPQFFPPANLPAQYTQAIRAARLPGRTASLFPLLHYSLGAGAFLAVGLWLPAQRFRRRRRLSNKDRAFRVLIVTGIFPPDHGGPASYVPRIATALVRRGHSVEVICLSDQLTHDDSKCGFVVHRIHRGLFWPARVFVTTATIWRRARHHDLVFVNGLGAEAALAAALACRPALHKIVGDYAWERAVGRGWFKGTTDDYQRAPKSLRLRIIDGVRTLPLNLAEGIIVPSGYLRRIVSGWGISGAKIQVITNAVAAASDTTVARSLPGWSGKTLITVCRLVPWKGIDRVIRLLPDLPETRLVIAGDGHLRHELAELARSLEVDSRVVFLGDVPHGAIHGYLQQADAFVLNSSYEGLPHVVLEAFAARVPVIATNAGGTGEVVQDGVTGLLVPTGDRAALQGAIEKLWRDPSLGRALAEEAFARSRTHFDFDAMVHSTERALSAVLNARGSSIGGVPAEAKS